MLSAQVLGESIRDVARIKLVIECDDDDPRDPLAVVLGSRGGAKGGKARALALTPERRREIARMGGVESARRLREGRWLAGLLSRPPAGVAEVAGEPLDARTELEAVAGVGCSVDETEAGAGSEPGPPEPEAQPEPKPVASEPAIPEWHLLPTILRPLDWD